MQTSAKLLALHATVAWAEVTSKRVPAPQHGFVTGRSIHECVVGLDAAMVAASLYAGDRAMADLFNVADASRV